MLEHDLCDDGLPCGAALIWWLTFSLESHPQSQYVLPSAKTLLKKYLSVYCRESGGLLDWHRTKWLAGDWIRPSMHHTGTFSSGPQFFLKRFCFSRFLSVLEFTFHFVCTTVILGTLVIWNMQSIYTSVFLGLVHLSNFRLKGALAARKSGQLPRSPRDNESPKFIVH